MAARELDALYRSLPLNSFVIFSWGWKSHRAVGGIEKIKLLLGFKAKGRDIVKGEERYHLREEAAPIWPFLRPKKAK